MGQPGSKSGARRFSVTSVALRLHTVQSQPALHPQSSLDSFQSFLNSHEECQWAHFLVCFSLLSTFLHFVEAVTSSPFALMPPSTLNTMPQRLFFFLSQQTLSPASSQVNHLGSPHALIFLSVPKVSVIKKSLGADLTDPQKKMVSTQMEKC